MKTHRGLEYISAAFVLLAALAAPSLQAGASLNLNGSSQYVEVPASATLTTAHITLEAWIKIPAAGFLTILSRGNFGVPDINDYIFQISNDGTTPGTQVSFFGTNTWDASSSSIPISLWTHVAVTYDGTNKQFYINGVSNGTALRPGALYSTTNSPLYIGRQGGNCDCNFFHGAISEVRIWSTVRTASQIAADMLVSPDGSQPGLLAYYHLNEGSGTIAYDASGNGNTGTLMNGAGWTNTAPAKPVLGTTSLLEGPAAGSNSVVLASPATPWTATNNTPWLHLSAANQSGTEGANVIFSFDANNGPTRTGTLTIAGQTLTVTQAGSNYVAATGAIELVGGIDLPNPQGVAVDSAGNVYVADGGIYEWSATTQALTPLTYGPVFPSGLAVDAQSNLYIADTGYGTIDKWVAASNILIPLITNIVFAPPVVAPSGVALDGAGNVYFSSVMSFSPHIGVIEEWITSSNTLRNVRGAPEPVGLAVDVSGNIYYSDEFQDAVIEFSPLTAGATTFLVLPGAGIVPVGVAVDGTGNVFFADSANKAIKEWSASSKTVSTLVPTGGKPVFLAVDARQNIYFSENAPGGLFELPRAFVDATPKLEPAAAGSDILPAVVPATQNLSGPFAPKSDQPWLTITGATNGVVSFAFSANTGPARTAHITVLGRSIPVSQQTIVTTIRLTAATILPNGSFQFAFTNAPGASFTVLSTTNLSLPLSQWTPIGLPVEGPPGQYQFTGAATNSQTFYAIRTP